MKSYFTTIEKINDNFFGSVTDNENKQLVYRTIGHPSHANAVIDVNNFLQNQGSNTHGHSLTSHTITNTTTYTAPDTSSPGVKRCCGR